jgi:predicted RecB family nuclease
VRVVDGRVVFAASDLNDYLACPHRVALNRRALARGDARPQDDPTLELIARKGREHERRELERLEASGIAVVRVPEGDNTARDLARAVEATREAMASAAAAIYQASFLDGAWTGRADFLVRVEEPSRLGAWSYEVADTKLATGEKPEFIVQLCVYAELLAAVQGALPRRVRAVLGDGRETAYDPSRYVAYVHAAKRRFEAAIATLDPDAVPDRIPACEHCAWATHCDAVRRGVDHLSLVAGMRRDQTKRLVTAGIPTLERLAGATAAARPQKMVEKTFATLQRQALLQSRQRASGKHFYELLEPRELHGFGALPRPADGDVYFDMEGDPLYEPGVGLEYLFGAFVPSDTPLYRDFWGETRADERRAFERFVDWLVEHRARHPQAHVYHYAAYEKTALRKLAMQHATREDAVDDLLRGEVLVDLYAVVKSALAQSQDGYSIKKLESFYGFVRAADVRKGDESIVAFEEYLLDRDPARKRNIIQYNEEDCVSTRRLHEWLLKLREEAEARYACAIPFRAQRDPKLPSEAELKAEAERDELQRALLANAEPGSARALLAHLLSYHRREDKPVWWALFDRYERDSDFVDDDTEALGGLELATEFAPYKAKPSERNLTYTYRFPAQQHKLGRSKPHDPHARQPLQGELIAVDDDALIALVKRAPDAPHSRALIPGDPLPRPEQKNALRRLAEAVLDGGAPSQYSAACEILQRARPRITGLYDGARIQPEKRPAAEAIDPRDVADLARRLDGSALAVQGPPGTGKTFTGAHVVAALLGEGKRIGVTSTSHKAINNLLHAVEVAVAERGATFRGVKKCDATNDETRFISTVAPGYVENADRNASFAEYELVAGTAWLFSRDDLEPVDYLIIDEAGQVALADALAMATNARNVILLGDPLQLAHVSRGTHPEGASVSVLEHLLAEPGAAVPRGTIPEDRGVFLDRTFRMHPALCEFVSNMVYEGRLCAAASCARQRIDAPWFSGAGLRYVPVEHEGNAQSSDEEATAVEEILAGLIGGTFTDRFGFTRAMTANDVLVVSPYNAQVRLLGRRLRPRFGDGIRVGTVDKFQGQEAPAVIYSVAASSADDAPRGADFLFEENRFNVALSRGRALAVLVCSPRLLGTRASSVEQLRAVAAFCGFEEAAAFSNYSFS